MFAHILGDEACEPGLEEELVCLRTLVAEDLIAELSERSEFVKTQLECNGDDSVVAIGAVKVPARAGKLWVRCLLRSTGALRTTSHATLVLFIKVLFVLFAWPAICCVRSCHLSCETNRLTRSASSCRPPLQP